MPVFSSFFVSVENDLWGSLSNKLPQRSLFFRRRDRVKVYTITPQEIAMTYLLLATCSSAVMAIVLRIFQNSKGNRYGIILGNYLICILISWLSLPDRSMVLRGSTATILCGLIGGFFFVAGLVTMQTSTRLNGATLTSVFAKMGLVISLAVSIFVFGEKPTPMQIAGVALILAALVLVNGPADEKSENAMQTGKVHTGALILTMLAGGGGSAMSKIFEQVGTRDQDALFFLYVFFVAAVLTAGLLILEWKRTGKALLWREMAAGIAVGIPNYYASFLLLLALVALPAILVYPINSTGSILIVMAVDALVFHQKYTRRQWLGILLVLVSMVLLNL